MAALRYSPPSPCRPSLLEWYDRPSRCSLPDADRSLDDLEVRPLEDIMEEKDAARTEQLGLIIKQGDCGSFHLLTSDRLLNKFTKVRSSRA